MGAIQLQTAAFPRALQREAESLSREKDVEIQADALRSFAARLERRHPELSIQIYGLLAEAPTTPPDQRKVAQERFDALQGRGTGGARWEAMIGRFLPEATDYRMIVPMMVATSVAGVVRAAALGRLAGSSGSWFSGHLGARIGAGSMAFAAEVPAFTLSGRALHALGGRPSEAPFSQDLAAAALSLGCLKGFVGLGAKISPNPALSAAVFAPAGLYTAHGLEERMGWRPASDSTSRAVDAIAASLSLGIGARLGREALGERWNRRFSELALRAESVRPRPFALAEVRAPWLPEPLLMAAESGGGKPPAAPEIPRPAESSESVSNREFKRSREIFRLSFMGDPVRNIEARLASSAQPLRILDLNPGDGATAGELRRRFGDRVRVETVKDRLESGDFLQADFGSRRYDLILALLGAPAAEGQLLPLLQKAVDHLEPGGEFTGAFSVAGLKHADVSTWRELETLPKIRAGLERGLALRLERAGGHYIFYGQRLGAPSEIPLREILSRPAAAPVASRPQTLAYLEKGLKGQAMKGAGREWYLEGGAASRIAEALLELGAQEALIFWPNLPQILLDRFAADFEKTHHRPPAAHEIQHWIDGREPSALHSKEIFVDEWLRLQVERSRQLGADRPSKIPGALLGGIVGLGTLLGSTSEAWAAAKAGAAGLPAADLASVWDGTSAGLIAAAGLGLVGSLILLLRGRGAKKNPAPPFKMDPKEKDFFDKVVEEYSVSRPFYRQNDSKSSHWILQLLAQHYIREEFNGRNPSHPVGDRLLIRAANANPALVSRLPVRSRMMIDQVRRRQTNPADETGPLNWTVNTEPDLSSEEITQPGLPKTLGRGRRGGFGDLGVGMLALLSPRIAEASDGSVSLSTMEWAAGLGIVSLGLLGAYGLGRWVSESQRRRRIEDLLAASRVPPEWEFLPPANQQGLLHLENVHFISEPPQLRREEMELVQTGSGARWYRVEADSFQPGWVKAERKKIFSILKRPHFAAWERELALQGLLERLVYGIQRPEDVGQAAKLMWDLALAPRAGAAGRQWYQAAYSAFIGSPKFFGEGAPPVYRECIRLRRIFSDEETPFNLRLLAVGAYNQLARQFDFNTSVGRLEANEGKKALRRFLEEGLFVRSSRPFMVVNGAWHDLDRRQFLWQAGQRVGLRAASEDWEGND